MKKIVTYLAAIGMILSMIPASVSAADTAPVSAAVQAEEEIDIKEFAGYWRYDVADGNYDVEVSAVFNGVVNIKDDGTFTYTGADGKQLSGKCKAVKEKAEGGIEVTAVYFYNGSSELEFGGIYRKDDKMISLGNGGTARLVHDTAMDEGLDKIAVEKINNYLVLDRIISGGLESENEVAFKEGRGEFHKVTDLARFKSIAEIKEFIDKNTAGEINKNMNKTCDFIFREKDGVLYERYAGKGSVGTDTTNGVIITDRTSDTFNATTIAPNSLKGSGHTRASFVSDNGEWKINGFEFDVYTINTSISDYEDCAIARVSTLRYFLDMLSKGALNGESSNITINGAEYVKAEGEFTSIEDVKKTISQSCTGELRESIFKIIESRLTEKYGVVYKKAEPGQSAPDFNLEQDMKILSITPDGFRAVTAAPSQKDGYAVFDFEKEGERFLISSYTFSSFNEERLFGGYVVLDDGTLNLRSEPNTSSEIYAGIPNGTQLDIYESGTNGWYKVEYNGYIGYVSADFIKELPVSTTTTTTATTVTTTSTTATKNTTTTSTAAVTTTTTVSGTLKAGDVTKDDVVDGRDATAILTYYAKSSTGSDGGFDDSQKKAAEVSKDGTIDGRDATLILTYYAYTSAGKNVSIDEFISLSAATITTTAK